LIANPFNYSAHEELVTLLRNTEDFEKLRTTRKKFSECYPLTPKLWIDWVSDELKILASEEDKKFVEGLFETGVKDYLSVDLWLEFCQYTLGGIGSKDGIDKARKIHEKAITACGLHVSKGTLIWETYREFELALLSMTLSSGSDEIVKSHTEQRQRVENLLKRQLRQPLLDMDKTLTEYKEFVGDKIDQNVISAYHRAREKLKSRESFEAKISHENPSLEDFKAYIDFEVKDKDPARIQVLYERAVTPHCLESTLWDEYLTYLETNLKISTVSLPVYHRAIRNCPWALDIWCRYLRALERYESPHSEILAVFEQALAAGFSDPRSYLALWLAFIDYSRRRTEWSSSETTNSMSELRTVFERAMVHLNSCKGDPDKEVSKYLAGLEADQFGSMENARKMWADIVQANPFSATVWLELIQLEKTFGDKKHLRKAFQRALEKVFDNPEAIIKSFTQFEREEGSLEAFESCLKLCKMKMDKVEIHRSKEKSKHDGEYDAHKDKVERKKEKDKQYRRDKRQEIAASKRENNSDNGTKDSEVFAKPNVPEMKPRQTMAMGAPPPGFQGAKKAVPPPPGFKKAVPPPPGFEEKKKRSIAPPPGFKGEPPAKRLKESEEGVDEMSEEEDKKLKTVFLSNLDFEVTDVQLKDLMSSSGAVTEVRLVKHATGKSKGYAFVEFESVSSAKSALGRDNELISKRPMYVSECDPSKKKAGDAFKFGTGLEKNKLFIKGLDPEVTRPELAEIFEKFGKVSAVRIVTYRNGHSKGIAFVDFEEEVSAATALVKTDNMKIRGKEIQVALSNPPKRKEEAPLPTDMKSLGGTSLTEFGPRGKGRTQMAFTPRSLVTQKATDKLKLEPMKFVKPGGTANNAPSEELPTANTPSTNGSQNKSNADFRKMFLQ